MSIIKKFLLTNLAITFTLSISWNFSSTNLWEMISSAMPKKTKRSCLISLQTINNLQLLLFHVLMTKILKSNKTKLMLQFSLIKVTLELLQMVIRFLTLFWTAILKRITFSRLPWKFHNLSDKFLSQNVEKSYQNGKSIHYSKFN